jgi:hypothetical protein
LLCHRKFVLARLPGHRSRQEIKKQPADPDRLLALLQRWREKAVKAGHAIGRIAMAFEAGRDGFWLARWLGARDIEAYPGQSDHRERTMGNPNPRPLDPRANSDEGIVGPSGLLARPYGAPVAARLCATPMQVALAWLLQRAPNILLIPGTSSSDHLRENLAAEKLSRTGRSPS